MHPVLKKIQFIGIVPVIRLDDPNNAIPLAKALEAGGLPCAEVTFRTAQGEESIRRIAAECPHILVGAGTVLTTAQVDCAIAAGAKFIVTPGFNPKVVAYCIKQGIPVVPGCTTPSDIELAIESGLEAVKFFPAEQSGGVAFLKAVSAPYPSVRFMPTGGVSVKNVNDYLSFDRVLACGGSWMVKPELIAAQRFDEITRLTAEAVQTMLGFRLAHVGINTENETQARAAAQMFGRLFGFSEKIGNSSIFAGSYVELMKTPYHGKHGHVAIATLSLSRAIAYLELNGVTFLQDSMKFDDKGTPVAIYLKEEIAGFAVHLVQSKD
ncbi:MAG: bifunctional 4-hydroxy-2-oxoglutarate aldolase/2-dehydro-3-deoxy-phosphogluconate aldolase [Clostridia bacterium]